MKQVLEGTTKTPRRDKSPDEIYNQHPSWQFSSLDHNGEWGWNNISMDDLCKLLLPKLKSYETMLWREIISKEPGKSHQISVSKLNRNPKKRLQEIGQTDIDDLFSLAIDGKRRVWGIKSVNILKIIWWDPDHTVCPSPKKHT